MSLRNLITAGGLALLVLPAVVGAAVAQSVGFTQAQVDAGHTEYRRSCLDCHGAELDDGEFGGAPLRGSSFKDNWFGGTADFLFDFMKANMPPDRPGALTDVTYANLMAYILSRNGIAPGGTALPADPAALANLTIE